MTLREVSASSLTVVLLSSPWLPLACSWALSVSRSQLRKLWPSHQPICSWTALHRFIASPTSRRLPSLRRRERRPRQCQCIVHIATAVMCTYCCNEPVRRLRALVYTYTYLNLGYQISLASFLCPKFRSKWVSLSTHAILLALRRLRHVSRITASTLSINETVDTVSVTRRLDT